MRYTLYTTLLFCFFSESLCAQHFLKISGVVSDSTLNKLEYAQLSLYKTDTVFVQSVLTDRSGTFNILVREAKYKLVLSYLGKVYFKTNIHLTQDLDMGILMIKADQDLSEVSISGRKKVLERKLDRLVFNVEHSIASQGMDVVDVLKNTPLVKVDQGGISLVGKSGLYVMIDGRILNMSGTDLMNYLKTLRSENVAKIEVITAPPAKYEAAGNSGMINIILKKSAILGWSGNITSSISQASYFGYSNTGSLNFKSPKTTFGLKIRQFDQQQKASEKLDLIGLRSVLNDTERKDYSTGIGANLSLNHNLTKNTDLGFIYDFSKTNNDKDIYNIARYSTAASIDSVLITPSTQKNPTSTHTLNLYYDLRLDTVGCKLSFGANYFSNQPEKYALLKTISEEGDAPQLIKNTSNMNYSIWSGQVDLTLPAPWLNLDLGAKYTRFNNSSEVKYFNYQGEAYELDLSKSNQFNYTEHNLAAYLNANKEINDKWSAQLGLRYEYSDVNGYSATTTALSRYMYGNLFPTVYLQFKPGQQHIFNVNYSKRINRPGFAVLNPFRWYTNPYSYYSGNPMVKPSFNHNLEFNYLYRGLLSLSLYGQKTVNGFGGITSFNDGIKAFTFENYLSLYNVGLTSTLDWNPLRCWSNYLSIVTYYTGSKSAIKEVKPVSGFSLSFSINNTITLNEKKTLFALLNYFQNLPAREVNVYSQGISNLSIGLKYALFQNKLFINGILEDPYKGSASKGEAYFQDFVQHFNNYYDNRRFTLSASYNFGKKSLKRIERQVKFNEKSRLN